MIYLCLLTSLLGKTVDDRHIAADFVTQHASAVYPVLYDPDFSLEINNVKLQEHEVEGALRDCHSKSVLIETTTVGFVELFLLIRSDQRW